MLVGIDSETSLPWLLASYVGFGLVNAPITKTALSGMPRSQAGVAAAVASTSHQIGAALGVAVVGSVLSSGLAGSLRTGFVAASHPAWWILAGCGLLYSVLVR
jgi:sugar phosphate permease